MQNPNRAEVTVNPTSRAYSIPSPGVSGTGVRPSVPRASAARLREDARAGRNADAYGRRLAIGLLLSVGFHVALFQALPAFRASAPAVEGREMAAVELPPEVRVPPPPERVARPAVPLVAETEVDEEVTIAPTTFEANPVEQLPPPPKAAGVRPEDRPVFIPRDVEPELLNRDEIATLLRRHYPPALRDAGVGGTVVLWVFVDAEGAVARTVVKEPSPYRAFDEASFDVAQQMRFRPALNRDRPIGVWVSQRIAFSVTR